MKFLTLGEKTNPAILALNGTLCSGEGLAPLWQRMAGEYYIILPTYDGCDGSGSVYQSEAEQAQKILSWLKKNGISALEMAHGTSMGGEVLMAFAALAEKQGCPVKHYVFDGGPFFHFAKPVRFVMEKKFQGFADMVRGKDEKESTEKLLASPLIQKLIGTDTAPYRALASDMAHVCQTADHTSIKNMVHTCYTFGFPKMPQKVQQKFHFLWSEKEPARKSEEKMRKTYPAATFRVVPGYMHCGYQTCAPDAYIEDMKGILQG